MVSAWRNFKNIFSRPLFIFRPEILKFHPYSILTGETMVEFVIFCVHNRYRTCCKTVNTNWMLVLSGEGSKRAQSYAILHKQWTPGKASSKYMSEVFWLILLKWAMHRGHHHFRGEGSKYQQKVVTSFMDSLKTDSKKPPPYKGCRNITVRPLFVLFRTCDLLRLFWPFSRHTWRRLHIFRKSSNFFVCTNAAADNKKMGDFRKKMAA